MKPLRTFLSWSLIAVLVGCATDKSALRTDAPAGLYCWTTNTFASYVMQPIDGEVSAHIREITTFTPQQFVIGAFHPNAETAGFSVDISGRAKEDKGIWEDWHDIVIVHNQKVYFGIAKRTGSSGEVFLATATRKQANAIVSMMRRRYSSPP